MAAESTLSPPAPLDLGRMEMEAKETAKKHIANLLQRPEQLERVDQYKRRISRKKASVDTMLKTAVQSQLDGVRTGLNQLQSALQDVYEIKQRLDEVEEAYKSISPLHIKLMELKKENTRYCQLASAMENLKHIFTAPEIVRKTEELINEGKLLQAHKHLTDLEQSRDDLMFELYKQPQQSPTDNNTLEKYFRDVIKLSDQLGKQLWVIIQRTLMSVRREPTLIVTALRIIEREERTDEFYLKRKAQTGFIPPGRPKKWREKCFRILEESISSRIEGNQFEDRSINKMWLVRHLEVTRQLMLEDLKVVKQMLPPIFPPEYNIVRKYVQMYHKALSNHFQDMIQQGLEGNEIVTLLQWVGIYNSPELMRHPALDFDTKEFGPLLETTAVDELQNQYLKTMKLNIMEWTKNSLTQDQKDWYRDEHPDADGDGYYSTSLPVIIFQMMEQNLQVAQMIGEDMVKKVIELFTDELAHYAKEYKGAIQSYKERHLQDRSVPKFFLHYMIANTNNCIAFGEYMTQLRKRYLKEELDNKDELIYIRKDRFQTLTDEFNRIGSFGANCILEEVFIDLKNIKCFEELMTKQWQQSTHAVEVICATWNDYSVDFVHLKPVFHTALVEEGQRRVLKEYLKALLSKKLSFKTYDERKMAADKICKEADQMASLFHKYTNKTQRIQLPITEDMFAVLPMLAEVLRLRDSSMMSLELTGLVTKYPDMKPDQLINLLMCRGDLSRADARQIVSDTIGDEDPQKQRPEGIFTDIPS